MLAGIFLAPLVLLGGLAFGLGRGSAQEKYDAITVGMTPAQVEAVLVKQSALYSLSRVVTGDGEGEMEWSSGDVIITIRFQGGRVVGKSQTGLDPAR
jgi:hypothetical protein